MAKKSGPTRAQGTVDRVEGDTVVVVIPNPDEDGCFKEVYVNKKDLKTTTLKPGDKVQVNVKPR